MKYKMDKKSYDKGYEECIFQIECRIKELELEKVHTTNPKLFLSLIKNELNEVAIRGRIYK